MDVAALIWMNHGIGSLLPPPDQASVRAKLVAGLCSCWYLVDMEVKGIPRSRTKKEAEADEHAMLIAAQAGDRGAFSSLVRVHLPLICSILSSSIRNRSDVDDLAQETFLKAWRSLPSLKAGAHFKPWLCRIAINLAHDDRRRFALLRPEPEVSLDHPDRGPSVVKTILGRELQGLIQEAIANLPEDLGLVFVLRVIEQRSYEEVAEILRIQSQTVRSQGARARRMLIESLARMRGEGGFA